MDPSVLISVAADAAAALGWLTGPPDKVRRTATLLAAFKAVNDCSPDGIMACWTRDGVYDNPMVGKAAEGFDAVRQCMVNLVDGLAAKDQSLIVDRVTAGERHVIAEWHVEPRDGRRGVHVAEFSDDGKLKRVTVYPRAS